MSEKPTTYGLPKKKTEVIEVLKTAYANENLEDQEYERRLDEATNAQSIEELKLVIFDFPPSIKHSIFPKTEPLPVPPHLNNLPAPAPQKDIQVILGNDDRKIPELGPRIVPLSAILSNQKLDFRLSQITSTNLHIQVECILSSTLLDLRNEDLDGKNIQIQVNGILGEVKVLLPRGAKIQKNIQLVMSDYKIKDKQRSWIKRLTGKSNQQTEPEMAFNIQVTGAFWLGSITFVY